jgi:hypothetical protein
MNYSADQIIGKSLTARVPVKIYRFALDTAPAVYTVTPSQNIGVVQSYLNPNENRSTLYWVFRDTNNRNYYVRHATNTFDVKSLSEQGALTTEQKAEEEKDKNLSLTDKIFKNLQKAVIIGAVVYLAATLIKSKSYAK